jgi:hypothetical protein
MRGSAVTDRKIWVSRPLSEGAEYALLDSPDDRDRLSLAGWAETAAEPRQDAWVWMRYPGVDGAQRFPVAAVPNWIAMGWAPGAPTEQADPTKDPEPPQSLAALSAAAEPVKPAPVGKTPKES